MTGVQEAQRRATMLLEEGLLGGAPRSAQALEPVPVVDPAGSEPRSWFIPIAVGDDLAGFAELQLDLKLIRYSAFPQAADKAAWTDPTAIRARAAAFAGDGETLGEPVLSYDGEPSRLAWLVTATDSTGRTRNIFVAGDFVYEA